MLLLPFQNGYTDNVGKVIRFDPEQAKRDLDAAGWPVGPDGARAKNGQRLVFSYVNTGDDPVGKAIAGGTAAMLKNVGVQIDIRQVPSGDFSKIVTGKQFDMFYSGVAQSDPFGFAYICQVYCSNSGLIKSGVNDPKNDELIRSVNTLPTPDSSTPRPPRPRRRRWHVRHPADGEPPGDPRRQDGAGQLRGRTVLHRNPEMIGWQK